MKQEFDKEMDSLLRRGSRFAAGPTSARAPRESLHLDTDELSAFAENALPAAARSHYASHLADCDECRKVVAQLASAADAAGEIEKRAATVPVVPVEIPWWKSVLGAVFTPQALRYATPVLILGLVGVVSFVALRSRQGRVPDTVYRPDGAVNTGVVNSPGASEGAATGDTVRQANMNPVLSSAEANKAASPGEAKTDSPAAASPATKTRGEKDVALADGDQPAPVAKEAGPSGAGEGADTKPKTEALAVTAPAPAPPPAKSAGTETTEPKKGAREDAGRDRAAEEEYAANERGQQQTEQNRAMQKRGMETQSPDGSSRNEARSNTVNNRGYSAGQSTAQSRAERPAPRRTKSDDKARESAPDDDEVANTDARSIAGHRFRREGNIWVDVKYKSSMSMTGVRRGTDRYRALIADVPELGRIAEQLGGEIIAVVKGRAYRIR